MSSMWYFVVLLMLNPCLFARAICTEERIHNRMSEILQKLCGLGELNPRSCLREAESMKVGQPNTHSQNQPLVMKSLFRFAYELFQNNTAAAQWNAQELRHLQNLLGQQSQCFPDATPGYASTVEEVESWSTFWTTLEQFLVKKDFSKCAWESVRPVVLQVMHKVCLSSTKHHKQQIQQKHNKNKYRRCRYSPV